MAIYLRKDLDSRGVCRLEWALERTVDDALAIIFDYHQVSKHSQRAFAPGPGYLDWATQPDPFRRYSGARLLPLDHISPAEGPGYDAGFALHQVPTAALDRRSISQLFLDSLALSAWKEYRGSRWSLRVNPSSGNLHPTEGYLLCGPIPGLCDVPMVAHYAPREHALEMRAELPASLWSRLSEGIQPGGCLVGLTSIHWREAWKYGERAYRYGQHDVGHALAAISIAASGLGWRARLVDGPSTDDLAALLGVGATQDAERELPDCLVAILPQGMESSPNSFAAEAIAACGALSWQGVPNRLSAAQVTWPWLEEAASATRKPRTAAPPADTRPSAPAAPLMLRPDSGLRVLLHQRRSAVEMDGVTAMPANTFYEMLQRTFPASGRGPFNLLPWPPNVHLGLFVHRVTGLASGLYLLARDPSAPPRLRAALRVDAAWETPPGCPSELPLFLLLSGDARSVARQVSCSQDIAADGCFSVAMLADFEGSLAERGAWYYPRLYWECGMIGQVLYLEAEAAGLRGTGIGCFFDDAVHALFGLRGEAYQSLYHFTVGGPEEDTRLTTLPPYESAP
jgi:SagB-type dehydrogenase family enzyme